MGCAFSCLPFVSTADRVQVRDAAIQYLDTFANCHLIVMACPGAGKTWLLVACAIILNMFRTLTLVFNHKNMMELRSRGATNSHTFDSYANQLLCPQILAQIKAMPSKYEGLALHEVRFTSPDLAQA